MTDHTTPASFAELLMASMDVHTMLHQLFSPQVTRWWKMQATFSDRLHLENMPFDRQLLRIQAGVSSHSNHRSLTTFDHCTHLSCV